MHLEAQARQAIRNGRKQYENDVSVQRVRPAS
jgi:hypothetical protein